MAKKLKKINHRVIRKRVISRVATDTEKFSPINPVRYCKIRKIKLPKPLSGELSNPVRNFTSKRKKIMNAEREKLKVKQIPSKSKISNGANGVKKTKIRVVGIGGGGGNIVSELAVRVKKATFLAANTDLQALKQVSRKVERFSFGQGFTRGLGTGLDPEIAETAGQNEKERIKKILQGQDLVIFVACLGGGTGSGAAPIFAKISQSLGNLSYGIFTLPFKFEGEKKMEIAKRALEILRPKLNAITILPNERIFQVIDKTTPLKEAFSAINKSLAQSLEGLIETIHQPGLINIDFADLRTILSESPGKLAYLNTFSFVRKEGVVKEVAERTLAFPLYPYGIKGAKGVLFNIVAEKGLSLEEVSQISKTILEKAHPEAKIIFGVQPLSSKREVGSQNIIKMTIFATGCQITSFQNFGWGIGETQKKSRRRKTKRPKDLSIEARKPKTEAVGVVEVRPQQRKVKSKKPEKKLLVQPETKTSENPSVDGSPTSEGKIGERLSNGVKIRKNALELKKELEEEEKKMLEKEKFWETPAFLKK